LDYNIIVRGTPKSVHSSPRSRNTWKTQVATGTSSEFNAPLEESDLRVTITVFYNGIPAFDADNVSKPICDAMCGIAYHDDNQLMERTVRMRSLDGAYRIKGVPRKLAVAMSDGDDFVWITISRVGREVENL
jgi:crossover junction endodeoxyribonuclease RusA